MARAGSRGGVRVNDRGMNRIVQNAGKLSGYGVKIGILASAPPPDAADPDFTLAALGSVHEYGSDNTPAPIPERSFIRSTVDEQRAEIDRKLAAAALAVEGGSDPVRELAIVGLWFQGAIQAKITNGPFVPNAPLTIALKGSSVPLIDTGRLRASISFEVVQP